MNKRVAEIFAQAQQLSPEERAELVDLLLVLGVPEPHPDPAWMAEIERRVESVERGDAVLYDADEVMARLRARCG